MRWNIALVTTVLLVGLYATEAKAQSITIKNVDTSTAGQLTVTADVTLPQGSQVQKVTMQARPPKGAAGPGGVANGKDTGGNVYAGTITGLTSGNMYEVQAVLVAADQKSGDQTTYKLSQNRLITKPA